MARTMVVGFRANPLEAEELQALARAMDCRRSEVLRRLVRAANSARPAQVNVEIEKLNREDESNPLHA